MINHFALAWRLLKRDWQAGELKILVLALLIAVASMTSIGMFTSRINIAMTDQAGQFLGADLILRSPNTIDSKITDAAQRHQLDSSAAIGFSSVIVANDNFQLTHVKAVDQSYPLLSQIKISNSLYGEERAVNHGPAVGEVWLVPRVFSLLSIKLGDTIELGETQLKVTAVLKHDPGQASSFMSIAPRMLMNIQDVEKTNIIQPGSRVSHQLAFAGPLDNRAPFEAWLRKQLSSSEKLLGGTEGSEAINSAMSKAEQYLSLAAMLSVMLSGIAIAMTANRYGQRHFDQSALMRCMGASQQTIVQIFTWQLVILGTVASILGCLLGYLAQAALVVLLQNFLAPGLPSPGIYPLLTGFISGFITLAGFSLPALLRLKSVSPLRVLRNDINPLPVSAIFVYGLALGSLVLMMWWQSGRLSLTLIVIVGVLASTLLLFVLSAVLIKISQWILTVANTKQVTGAWKIGLQQLIRQRKKNQLQMLAFGLSLMILMTIFLLRTDLIDRWQSQLPDQAPNHFVVNIQENEVAAIQQFFSNNGIKGEGVFPMVRGRVKAINNRTLDEIYPDKNQLDESLKRELNLSWANQLQTNNQLAEGQWWTASSSNNGYISIEQGLAKRLKVSIGDQLSFQIADKTVSAEIKNIRTVQWDSFQPNFYVIFEEGVINRFPVSFISSFYLPAENKRLLNDLVKQFPTLTILEVDAIMEQVKSIMQQVSTAVEFVMLFVLFAGMMVLVAAMQSSMDERIQASVIMRCLGAKKVYINRSQLTEFGLLGFFAGLLAVSGTEIIAYLLYTKVFDLTFNLHIWLWLLGPFVSVVLILAISHFYTAKVTQQSPLKVLRYV